VLEVVREVAVVGQQQQPLCGVIQTTLCATRAVAYDAAKPARERVLGWRHSRSLVRGSRTTDINRGRPMLLKCENSVRRRASSACVTSTFLSLWWM